MKQQHSEILKELKGNASKVSKTEFQKQIEAYVDMDYDYLEKLGGVIRIGTMGENMVTVSFIPHGMKDELYSFTSQKTFMFNFMKLRARIDNDNALAEAADLLYPYPISVGHRNEFDHIFRSSKSVMIGSYSHEIRACALTTQLPSSGSQVCLYIYLATGKTVLEALLNVDRAKPQPAPLDPLYLMGNPS